MDLKLMRDHSAASRLSVGSVDSVLIPMSMFEDDSFTHCSENNWIFDRFAFWFGLLGIDIHPSQNEVPLWYQLLIGGCYFLAVPYVYYIYVLTGSWVESVSVSLLTKLNEWLTGEARTLPGCTTVSVTSHRRSAIYGRGDLPLILYPPPTANLPIIS